MRPTLPFRNQSCQYFRMLFCHIKAFCPIFYDIIQFPFLAFFITDSLPISPADRSVVLMLPIHIFMQGVRFLMDSRKKTAADQRINFISGYLAPVASKIVGMMSGKYPGTRHHLPFLFPNAPFHDRIRGVEMPPS